MRGRLEQIGTASSPRVAQPVLYEDFAVRRVNRVELLTVGADCRLVSVPLAGGYLRYERLNVPPAIGTAITEWEHSIEPSLVERSSSKRYIPR